MDHPATYTNLRTEATFLDWPSGRYRTACRFQVERSATRGERVACTTQHSVTKQWNAPKKTTYGLLARIADGEDGGTYILTLCEYGGIVVMQSDCQLQAEWIPTSDPRHATLVAAMQRGK